jgi:pimeloyl-ACP methyl ester carboxylesterase
MSAIILQGEIVHYEVLGRGRPLIFLHGWVGSWRYWIPSMQAASVSFRSYAIDMWGFGETAKDPSRYLLEQQVNLLRQFLDEMGIVKIAIIGHGLGAIIALMFAEHQPNSVDRVMAVSLPLDVEKINPRIGQASPEELAAWLLGSTQNPQAVQLEASKADQNAVLRSLTNISSIGLDDLIANQTKPCLLVHGGEDPAVMKPQIDRLAMLPEHYHLISFDDSGHFPMLDHPNKFSRLMTDFLTLDSGESPRQLQIKEEWKRRIR